MLGRVVPEVVEEYGFDIANIAIVTNNAANKVAAFHDRCCHRSCFAHCLNLVMVDILATENGDFQSLLTRYKSLVRHFKLAGLQNKLDRTLKQECPTRWNSTYIMVESKTLEKYRLAISNNYVAYCSKRKSHVTPGRKF